MSKCKDDGSILTLFFDGNRTCNSWDDFEPDLIQESFPNHPCCSEGV